MPNRGDRSFVTKKDDVLMITEIAENFYRLTLPMPFRLRHVHVYALLAGCDVLLFDTGMAMPGAFEKLETDLRGIGVSVASVRKIYLTHVHTDHCGMTALLQEKSKASLYLTETAHRVHAYFQEGKDLIAKARSFYARHGMPARDVEAVVEEIEDMRSRIPLFADATFLQEGDVHRFGNRSFEVMSTPGHAAGHVCFFFREEGLLLAGDHVLPYIVPSLGPALDDETFQPLPNYLKSLSVIETLPVETVHPGHGNAFSGLADRICEIRAHHALKKEILQKSIGREPKTTFDICAQLTGPAATGWDDWEKFMALNDTYVYLQALKNEEAVRETMDHGRLYYTSV
jgi:glyoxylase-like metal-dependent hydrolase (beta-lactamase superfamily II)